MWTHYCACERDRITLEAGEPCNWCNARPPVMEVPGNWSSAGCDGARGTIAAALTRIRSQVSGRPHPSDPDPPAH